MALQSTLELTLPRLPKWAGCYFSFCVSQMMHRYTKNFLAKTKAPSDQGTQPPSSTLESTIFGREGKGRCGCFTFCSYWLDLWFPRWERCLTICLPSTADTDVCFSVLSSLFPLSPKWSFLPWERRKLGGGEIRKTIVLSGNSRFQKENGERAKFCGDFFCSLPKISPSWSVGEWRRTRSWGVPHFSRGSQADQKAWRSAKGSEPLPARWTKAAGCHLSC